MIQDETFILQRHLLLLYTDPGSGQLLLQLIMASLLGGTFYFRKFISRLFKRGSDAKDTISTSEGTEDSKSDNTYQK